MRKLIFSTTLVLAIATNAISQNGAAIEFKISSTQGATGSIKVYYSTPGSRMEMQINIPQMPMGGFSKINITKKDKPNTVYTLDEKNKTYTTTETKPAAAANTSTSEDYTVTVVGKEKVGNYNCTHSKVTKGTETNEFWTTKEIPEYEKYKTNSNNKYMGSSGEYEALVKKGADGFMVKTITKDSRGGDFTMELVKFEKKEIAASMFDIPADYKAAAATASPTLPGGIDINKIQSMTPEERAKYIEEMKKKYGAPKGN